jgi:hypothetical protein
VNTSQPASARFAQSYVFTVNDAFVFIFSVGGHPGGHIGRVPMIKNYHTDGGSAASHTGAVPPHAGQSRRGGSR